jgi:hypothetical protein
MRRQGIGLTLYEGTTKISLIAGSKLSKAKHKNQKQDGKQGTELMVQPLWHQTLDPGWKVHDA